MANPVCFGNDGNLLMGWLNTRLADLLQPQRKMPLYLVDTHANAPLAIAPRAGQDCSRAFEALATEKVIHRDNWFETGWRSSLRSREGEEWRMAHAIDPGEFYFPNTANLVYHMGRELFTSLIERDRAICDQEIKVWTEANVPDAQILAESWRTGLEQIEIPGEMPWLLTMDPHRFEEYGPDAESLHRRNGQYQDVVDKEDLLGLVTPVLDKLENEAGVRGAFVIYSYRMNTAQKKSMTEILGDWARHRGMTIETLATPKHGHMAIAASRRSDVVLGLSGEFDRWFDRIGADSSDE
jgi:hypothetical protein